jgi:thymidylate synthase ThyX
MITKNSFCGSQVSILDDSYMGDPEARAMLQAMYSRSQTRIADRVEKLGGDLTKVKAALKEYYVGYGHRSIGQCAEVTIFIEGISMYAAKMFEHNPLFRGQETSSRYVDFTKNNIITPTVSGLVATLGNPDAPGVTEYAQYQLNWVSFVEKMTPRVSAALEQANPIQDGQDPKVWKRSIHASTFDILRGSDAEEINEIDVGRIS